MKAAAAGFDVAIVTGDKDFFQLVSDGIRVFNPRDEGTWYDADGVKEKFGVAPEQVVDVLALMGDTIDNIKGVPGHRRQGRARADLQIRIARKSDRPRRRDSAEAVSRTAARQRRVGAAEPRARAHPDRRARSSSTPMRFATAAPRASAASRFSTSWRSGRWSPSTHRLPRRSPRRIGSSTRPRASRRSPRGLKASGRSPCASLPDRPSAMTASIVGLAFSTAPREADLCSYRASRRSATRARCRLATALARSSRLLEDAASPRSATT